MKQTYIVTMIFIFAASLLVPFTSTANANSVQIFRTGWEPIELVGFNNCNGESFSLTGMTHSQVTVIEEDSGGFTIQAFSRIRGTAVGLVTGAKYIDAGEGGSATTHSSAFNGTFVGNLQINGVNLSVTFKLMA